MSQRRLRLRHSVTVGRIVFDPLMTRTQSRDRRRAALPSSVVPGRSGLGPVMRARREFRDAVQP